MGPGVGETLNLHSLQHYEIALLIWTDSSPVNFKSCAHEHLAHHLLKCDSIIRKLAKIEHVPEPSRRDDGVH
jgi:hypothetical protein